MSTLPLDILDVDITYRRCAARRGSRHEEARSSSPTPSQRQAQILQTQFSPQELAFQESLIQEREAEIREIETGIHELHTIFRDLGTLVQEQGGMIGTCLSTTTL